MSLQTIEINSVKVNFDKEKTQNHRTEFNKPCDCQDCRNFYKNIENNPELVEFLSDFGIDYRCSEDVFSWNSTEEADTLIHSEAHYSVDGQIECEELSFERFGVNILFTTVVCVPHDRTENYFWIIVQGDFPYILEEKREIPTVFSKTDLKTSILDRIIAIFKKK